MDNKELKNRIQKLEVAIKVKEQENERNRKLLEDNGITGEESYRQWLKNTDDQIHNLESQASELMDDIEKVLTAAEESIGISR